jgi:hypothetical protein
LSINSIPIDEKVVKEEELERNQLAGSVVPVMRYSWTCEPHFWMMQTSRGDGGAYGQRRWRLCRTKSSSNLMEGLPSQQRQEQDRVPNRQIFLGWWRGMQEPGEDGVASYSKGWGASIH